MGKLALIAIATFTVMASYYGINAQRGRHGSTSSISQHQYEVMARNAALAGFERAKQQLAKDFTGSTDITFDGSHSGADYTVTIKTDPTNTQLRDVRVISKLKLKGAENQKYDVQAKFNRVNQIPEQPPKAFQYTFFSSGDLTLNGEASTDTVKVEGNENNVYNSNVHANGKLWIKGNNVSVRGFGTYATSLQAANPENTFEPYYNPAGEPVVQQVAPIDIASFDPATMQTDLETTYVRSFDKVSSGDDILLTQDFESGGVGTREYPYLWRVKGNLSTGSVSLLDLSGYAIIIVDGSLTFQGDTKVATSSVKKESTIAFYVNGDVTVGGGVNVIGGQIFTNGTVAFNGSPEIDGSIVTKGGITGNGAPKFDYLPASPALTSPWAPYFYKLKLLAYSER